MHTYLGPRSLRSHVLSSYSHHILYVLFIIAMGIYGFIIVDNDPWDGIGSGNHGPFAYGDNNASTFLFLTIGLAIVSLLANIAIVAIKLVHKKSIVKLLISFVLNMVATCILLAVSAFLWLILEGGWVST